MKNIYVPDFTQMPDDELATITADLQFQVNVHLDYLSRAQEEQALRRKSKREGRMRYMHPENQDEEPGPTRH